MSMKRSLILLIGLLLPPSEAQIARNAPKFLGNIASDQRVPSDFSGYWNQVTPESCGSWYAIEWQRGVRNWSCLDSVDAYARRQGIHWTFHSLVISGSYPAWMASLAPESLKVAFDAWMAAAAARYPEVSMVEVVCEGHPRHLPPQPLVSALGGKGATGRDWIVEAFRMARRHFPKATLILSDYDILEDDSTHHWFLETARTLLREKAPLDAIGCEPSRAYQTPSEVLKARLDVLADTIGLPIYITQYDVPLNNDSAQAAVFARQFPLFYEHPAVKGVTLWGYVKGKTFREGSWLIGPEGQERPALTWLRDYFSKTTGLRTLRPPRSPSKKTLEIRRDGTRLIVGILLPTGFVPLPPAR